MNYIKRTILSIRRRMGKSALLFLIVFLLGNLIAGSYAIVKAMNVTKDNIKQGLGANLKIHADSILAGESYDYRYGENGDNHHIYPVYLDTVEQFNKIVKDDSRINNADFMYYYTDFSSREIYNNQSYGNSNKPVIDPLMTNIATYGVSQPYFYDLTNNQIQITEGRTFTEDEIESGKKVILLNEEFYKADDKCKLIKYDEKLSELKGYTSYSCYRDNEKLKVGDTVKFVRQLSDISVKENYGILTDNDYEKNKVVYEEEVEFEVIGFYKIIDETRNNSFKPYESQDASGKTILKYESTVNKGFYLPQTTLMSSIDEFQKVVDAYVEKYPKKIGGSNNLSLLSLYVSLNDPEELNDFTQNCQAEFTRYGLKNMVYRSSKDTYDLVAGPVESLSNISGIVLILSIIISVVVLALVIVLFLKDRRKEMGIYVSIGERKGNIVKQILFEIYIIGILAVTLSIGTGQILGGQITSSLLASSSAKQNAVTIEKLKEIGTLNETTMQMIKSEEMVEFEMNAKYIVSLYLISFLVLTGSSIVPVLYVLRIEPKKILM